MFFGGSIDEVLGNVLVAPKALAKAAALATGGSSTLSATPPPATTTLVSASARTLLQAGGAAMLPVPQRSQAAPLVPFQHAGLLGPFLSMSDFQLAVGAAGHGLAPAVTQQAPSVPRSATSDPYLVGGPMAILPRPPFTDQADKQLGESDDEGLFSWEPDLPPASTRADAPIRRPYTRGSGTGLDDTEGDEAATLALRSSMLAPGTSAAHLSRIAWWAKRCAIRQVAAYPLSPSNLELAAALLRKGGYRSGHLYLASIKRRHIHLGHDWSNQLQQILTDSQRAVVRGKGPDKQADAFPLEAFVTPSGLLPTERFRQQYWPAAGFDAVIVSCAWLLREVESSSALLSAIVVHEPTDEPGSKSWVTWDLPASKTDIRALGSKRSLGCACPSLLCPSCALQRVVRLAQCLAPSESNISGFPLLCKFDGTAMSKAEVVKFYRDLLQALGGPHLKLNITGHSPRATGAMRMATSGHSEWVIQMFGRWGSPVVLRYVRDALLGREGGTIAQQTEGNSLGARWSQAASAVKQTPGVEQLDPLLTKQAIRSLMEQVTQDLMDKQQLPDLASFTSQFQERMVAFEARTAELAARQFPSFVQCAGGKRHVTVDWAHTHCGWTWAASRATPIVDGPSAKARALWCSVCFGNWSNAEQHAARAQGAIVRQAPPPVKRRRVNASASSSSIREGPAQGIVVEEESD